MARAPGPAQTTHHLSGWLGEAYDVAALSVVVGLEKRVVAVLRLGTVVDGFENIVVTVGLENALRLGLTKSSADDDLGAHAVQEQAAAHRRRDRPQIDLVPRRHRWHCHGRCV